jgi:hypothetical protein
MRRLFVLLFAVLPFTTAVMACATYRDDLDRAMVHYHGNEYDKALALLEVLENDIDSLSPSERAQYSYYRGLSHYRLDQRQDARHWLGVAAARDKAHKGALTPEERKRVDDTLAELNEARWGGAKTEAATKKCTVDTDCDGQKCENGQCKSPEPAKTDDKGTGTESAPPGDSPAN